MKSNDENSNQLTRFEQLKQQNIETINKLKTADKARIDVYHGRVFSNGAETQILNKKEASEVETPLTLINNGGFTLVEIKLPDGTVFSGKESVKSGNQFNRSIGYHRAVAKALRNLRNK
jgi:hypothetical protein